MGMYFPRKYAILMKFIARLYKQKIFKFNLLGVLGFAKDRKNDSMEIPIIKDAKVYDKISTDNGNFVCKRRTNNILVNTDEDNNLLNFSQILTNANLNSASKNIYGKNYPKML